MKMEQLLNLKKKAIQDYCQSYAFRVLNRKLLSQNNVEYSKPLCAISLVGAREGEGGGGLASKTLIYNIS